MSRSKNIKATICDNNYTFIEVCIITDPLYTLTYDNEPCSIRKTFNNNNTTYARTTDYTLTQVLKLVEKYNKLFNTTKFGYMEVIHGSKDTI